MAQELKFLLDGADRGQPTNYLDFGISITEDTTIQARVVSFDNPLIFIGESYEYIFGKVLNGEHCNLIKVEVQYQCDNIWKKLVDGYFVITESDFDLDRCQVNTK